MLDEILIGGHMQESSKKVTLQAIQAQDNLIDEVAVDDNYR